MRWEIGGIAGYGILGSLDGPPFLSLEDTTNHLLQPGELVRFVVLRLRIEAASYAESRGVAPRRLIALVPIPLGGTS